MKKVVTDADIQEKQRDGVFTVSREMVLTPAAREFANRQGITLEYSRAEPAPPARPVAEAELARIIEQVVIDEVTRASADSAAAPVAATPPAVSAAAAMDPAARAAETMDEERLTHVLALGKETEGNRAIVTVLGMNRPGIVARISAVVAECGGDLADISQVLLDRYFSMIFIVGLDKLEDRNLSFRVFKERLQDEAARIGQLQVLVMHEDIFRAMHKV